ncbi:N-acetylgalactosamine-6-O-sulfatase [Paenibacillus solanacearum]|uniref:N-acetylgalactosamine-6-O-sulfatase n=1 Tax=Paenibacillus solanacearum TaxID=2048548 RepID=A0A916JZX9_9BACL|nr:arylsulfatase [Paenibacillus solanacearum]CAG7616043.1 N-acetylgalactosamine-6-O-sulfatase [Paenibacillus solanacearum]
MKQMQAEPSSRPNIIYILADDMGYGDVSCLNTQSRIRTPHLDRMAEAGMRCTDAHSSSAVCTPSRYSILTGRYNWRSSLKKGVFNGYAGPLIEPGRMTVASLLKEAGYRTACIGKWHLGFDWHSSGPEASDVDYTQPIKNGPTAVGFDYFYGISASLDMPPYVYIENDRVTALPNRITRGDDEMAFWREGPTGADFRHEEVLPRCTQKALETIEAAEDAPFFLYFPLPAPHTPILPSAAFEGQSGTNRYGDFVLMCDDVVGQMVAKLEQCGISDRTIVMFTSDNGCSPKANFPELTALGHHPSYRFRGTKADIYEGGHRVPLLVQWPERIQAGSVSHETVCLSDLLATAADIVGERLPDDAGEDSVSNLPLWLGHPLDGPLREAVVHHSINGSFSIRKGSWKLELCPGSGGWSDPRPGQEPPGAPSIQLYDLDDDIGERSNQQAARSDVVEELLALLAAYVRDGRSTPGARQSNAGGADWEQGLAWMGRENG